MSVAWIFKAMTYIKQKVVAKLKNSVQFIIKKIAIMV